MASRLLLLRPRTLAPVDRVRGCGIHTSRGQFKLLDKLGLFKRPGSEAEAYVEPWKEESGSIMERLGVMRRGGGYDKGAGMPLYMPVKAKNIERAWEIWARYLRQPDPKTAAQPTRQTLVELLVLIVNAPNRQLAEDQSLTGYRTASLLRYILASMIREQAAQRSGELAAECSLDEFDLKLGLQTQDYERIIGVLGWAVDSELPSGNTYAIPTLDPENLALEIGDMSVTRLIQTVLVMASQEKVIISAEMAKAALNTAVVMHDMAAACDILGLWCSDLPKLLNPYTSSTAAAAKALDKPQSDLCCVSVDAILELISVGNNPQHVSADSSQPQEDLPYEQLDNTVDYSDKGPTDAELKTLHAWRTETAERVYRSYISAGISQIPSPDNSSRPALQGSVVPTPQMVSRMLKIHLAAGDAEQAALYHEALKTLLARNPKLSVKWPSIIQAGCNTGHLWLVAQIMGTAISNGWTPRQSTFEQYIDAVADSSEDILANAIDQLLSGMQTGDVPIDDLPVRKFLILSLVGRQDLIPADFMKSRIEQALKLHNESSSDNTSRKILYTMIDNGQVVRAQSLADKWAVTRPGLVTDGFVAKLIQGLGRVGEHAEALKLFADYQQLDTNEATLKILCAVLEVYMRAGDYAEAISVGKRIRAMVHDNARPLPGQETYNLLLSAYCQETQPTEAMRVLEEMRQYKVHANSDTYTVLMQSMGSLRSLDGLKLISALANVDYNMVAQENLYSPDAYSRPLPLETDYYNAMIEAFGRVGEPMLALQVWEVMRFRGVRPNHLTATLLMDTCGWCERVHWDEDMVPQKTFVNHEVPDDYVYTGIKLLYLHFLGSALKQLQDAGLEFSLANYQHMIETLLRGAFLDDVVTMLIGKYEDPDETAEWVRRTYDVRFERVNPLIREWVKKKTPLVKEGANEIYDHAAARFMTDYLPSIPLCEETVATTYGAVEVLRGKFVSEDDPRVEVQLAYKSKQLVFDILDLHEHRLDMFLASKRPDLLPEHRRLKLEAADAEDAAQA
ncbi:hypothetical protein LPJ78_000328 [Coemansia sp. RSA 989]|nr:hypothetical protein BX667DRAFT_498176 [Coemansia mojavensis]KAJ1740888.1 hypothetical protein LPJ68_003347 [Coemansia sp. RSA 1086]KAJ1868200.1 hypothetical protein LPJ78_000328 [Coemansia sp. RSA 989]KAJ2677375.1 hypothetical protein IWW42_000182 [Coemansia sp. RSA 1085]